MLGSLREFLVFEVVSVNDHMRPRGNPERKRHTDIDRFQCPLILPCDGKSAADEDIGYGHANQVGMRVNERHVTRSRNAIDLWGRCTKCAPTESAPLPLMRKQFSGTARRDVGLPGQAESRPKMGMLLAPQIWRSAADSWFACLLRLEPWQSILYDERLTHRSPAVRAVASGLWPFIWPHFLKMFHPGKWIPAMERNCLPLVANLSSFMVDTYWRKAEITEVTAWGRDRHRSSISGQFSIRVYAAGRSAVRSLYSRFSDANRRIRVSRNRY
jgi:hypothetical protein